MTSTRPLALDQPAPSKSWVQRFLPDWKVCFVTLWLAGGLLAAEHSGWLDGLDNLMFAHAVDTSRAAPPSELAVAETLIVTISPTLYETAFRERSPLDPRVLDRILSAVVDSRPQLLAVDLDLSPSPSDADLADAPAARASLLARLGALASAGARVLVVLPGAASTALEQERKTRWASSACQAGVELADPNLGLTQTPAGLSLLKYVPHLPSLGVLMASPTREGLCASRNAAGQLPALMLTPNSAAAAVMNQSAPSERLRINFKGFDQARVVSLATLADVGMLAQVITASKTKNILLAGGYALSDTFALPNSKLVNGAEIHAAVAYSEKNPVRAEHLSAYLLDLFMGVGVGTLLAWLWHSYQRASLFHHKALCLTGAVGCIAAPSWLLIYLMPTALTYDLWINAVPLFIGLAVHGLIETLHTGHHAPAQTPTPLQSLLDRCGKYLWLLLRLVLAGTGLWLALIGFFHH